MTDPALSLAMSVAAVFGILCVATYIRGARRRFWARWRIPSIGLVIAAVVGPATAALAATPPPAVRIRADHPGVDPSGQALVTSGDHVVQRGDTLWGIAESTLRAAGVDPDAGLIGRTWRDIYQRNLDIVGPNPDLIFPGQVLSIPEV